MNVIAAGVSDALVATASGIFVAIFAYTYHQILKRKAYELSGLIRMQGDALLSKDV
jgi:biopolymer transport protein ExbB/TolQ